MSAFNAF
jgi:hypothetical protein